MEEVLGPKRSYRPLIENNGYFVTISHAELDRLIASLMHVAELDSDKEHREALKGELKLRCRDWLDSEYSDAGYEKFDMGPVPGAKIINLAALLPPHK